MSAVGIIPAQVAQAFNRFGLGGRPDDAIPPDPIAWLNGQLTGTDPLAYASPTTANGLGLVATLNAAPAHTPQRTAAQTAVNKRFSNEQQASLIASISTATPFRERLVRFWANHFAILGSASSVTQTCSGSFVREAIRPYVTDTFVNMLLAVMQHPAMLSSLNNDVSIGPQSQRGLATGAGINENLARETLELFTVGLAAGYTQADVDALAYMLTGWTISYTGPTQGFIVSADLHQPGAQTMLGQAYPGTLFDAYEALTYLGTHPLTYAHIATKLVEHFCSDTPDPNDVAAVVTALSNSGGSLSAAYAAIIGLTSPWMPQTKFRNPQDFALAAYRSVAANPATVASDVASLGQAVWQPTFPNGYSDLGADWASPAQMMLRTNWINLICARFGNVDPNATANTALGALINPATTAMLGRVTKTHDKLTILFCSPDFQRR